MVIVPFTKKNKGDSSLFVRNLVLDWTQLKLQLKLKLSRCSGINYLVVPNHARKSVTCDYIKRKLELF